MASDSANMAATSNTDSAAQAADQASTSSPATVTEVPAASTAASTPFAATTATTTTNPSDQSTETTPSAAATTISTSEPQPTPSSIQSAEPSDSTAQPTPAPATSSIAISSMLPRASGAPSSMSSSSSSPSSGTATPTARLSVSRSPAPASQYSRVASNNGAAITNSNTSAGRRVFSRRNAQASQNNQRAAPVPPNARNASAAASFASTYASNQVPSIFGFYSHDGSATGSTNASASSGAQWHPQPASRATIYQHHRAGSNSPRLASSDSLAYTVPGIGNLSFYTPAATRQQPRASSNLGLLYRSAEQYRTHASQSTSASASTDSSLLPSSLPTEQPTFQETTTISFTWTVRDLHLLQEEVELSPPPSEGGRSVSAGAGKSDVWTSQPVFGDNKWKLELVRTTRPLTDQPQDASSTAPSVLVHGQDMLLPENVPDAQPIDVQGADSHSTSPRTSITILSVYLTALVLDYTHANVEIPASIMVGLRPVRAAVGRRGAESGGYLWRRFYDFTFQEQADLFTCHDLPSVSEMLQDFTVARDDAIALTIQLGLGPGHTRSRSGQLDDAATSILAPVEVDGHHLVPRAVLSSLHGLLDDANTGDVRILVRERGILLPDASDNAYMSDDGAPLDDALADALERVVPFPIGSCCSLGPAHEGSEAGTLASIDDDPDRIFVRDRVLWAHASVLKSRSDYFRTMLASDFSEGISRSYGATETGSGHGRNVRTLQISDADFVTAYWFLRYLYTDDIQFADKEDVRSAVLDEEWAKGADLGYLTAGSASGDAAHAAGLRRSMLVNWTPISQLKDYNDFDMDELSYPMPTSAGGGGGRRDVSGSFVLQGSSMHSASSTSGSLRQRSGAAGVSDGAGGGSVGTAGGNAGARPLSAPTSPSAAAGASGAGKQHHNADEAGRVGSKAHHRAAVSGATLDPHDHPCAEPGPVSALSIFKLAHRYHMQDLSRLASLHIVATLTPQSAFPMLLATSMYTELHTRIKTYVYQHWHLVSQTHEFERCCDEVSVGMWGADAGKTMRAFVRSLVSPLRAAQG